MSTRTVFACPPAPRPGLEHGDLVLAVQQVGGGQPGDAGADDRDPHRLLLRATTRFRIIRCAQLQLSLDAQFLNVESARIYGHVAFLGIYDPSTAPGGKLGAAEVKRLLEERLHLLPPLRWRLVEVPLGLDLPYWADDPDFDLDFHVRETAMPAARRRPPARRDRRSACSAARWTAAGRCGSSTSSTGSPDGRVALLTKIHHSVVDGISGNEIMAVLLDPEPTGRVHRPAAGRHGPPPPIPRDREMLVRGLRGLPRQPLRALRSLPTTVAGFTDLPGANALPGRADALARLLARAPDARLRREHRHARGDQGARRRRRRSTARSRAHRRFAFGSLSLDAVRQVRREFGTTVNDVVVTLCAGAVREWLLERDALPEDPLVAMIPMSVRKRDERGTWGNRISMMVVPIPTNEPDPATRLQRTHELLRSAKERHSALPASLLTDATAFIPPAVASLAARNTVDILSRTRPPLNLVISNVPGPRTSLYCAGAELRLELPASA